MKDAVAELLTAADQRLADASAHERDVAVDVEPALGELVDAIRHDDRVGPRGFREATTRSAARIVVPSVPVQVPTLSSKVVTVYVAAAAGEAARSMAAITAGRSRFRRARRALDRHGRLKTAGAEQVVACGDRTFV